MFWEQLLTLSIRTVGNRENFGLFNNTFPNNGIGAGVSSLSTMNMEKAGCCETSVPLLTILDRISSRLICLTFMGPCIVIIFYYINPNKMHMLQSLFYLTTALHVSGVTITHLQEHKTTVTTASGKRYTVIDRVTFTDKEYR
jgi:hypothetical protein